MDLDFGHRTLQLAQYHRIARRRMSGLIGQLQDLGRRKTGSQPLQAPGGIFPIGITTRSAQKIDLSVCAFEKRRTQFRNEQLVVTYCGR